MWEAKASKLAEQTSQPTYDAIQEKILRGLPETDRQKILGLLVRKVANRYAESHTSEVSNQGLLCMLGRCAELELALLVAET